jgi:hypothetical protein
VWGVADQGVGVWGWSGQALGVRGDGGQVGVWGVGQGPGVGVRADSTSNDAVVATSAGARGVVGTTLSKAGIGVHGFATSGGGTGVRAISSTGSGLVASSTSGNAAEFFGTVVVIGGFVAVGPFKAAAVAHPDGTHRLTYSMESPESWFEDFGRSRLSGGRAEVRLDPDFAALVRTDDFHVFVTAEGETAGLYVAERSETGFEVREQRGGAGEVGFSYRVVARRRDADAVAWPPSSSPRSHPSRKPSRPPSRSSRSSRPNCRRPSGRLGRGSRASPDAVGSARPHVSVTVPR